MVLLHEMGHCLWNQKHYDPKPTEPDVMNAVVDWGVAEYLDYYRGVFQERIVHEHVIERLISLPY